MITPVKIALMTFLQEKPVIISATTGIVKTAYQNMSQTEYRKDDNMTTNKKLDITRCLTISTAHISEETNKKLQDEDDKLHDYGDVTVYKKEYVGFWIWCERDFDLSDNIPEDLARCINFTRDHNCEWLCLDCEGDIIDELPSYDW